MALIANANRDPSKHRVFKPADFNPYSKQSRADEMRITPENIGALKDLVPRRKR